MKLDRDRSSVKIRIDANSDLRYKRCQPRPLQVNMATFSADEWRSVFWNDTFTRPDVYTSYLNKTFKYDENKNEFSSSSASEKDAYNKSISETMNKKHTSIGVSADVDEVELGGGGKNVNDEHDSENRAYNEQERAR